MSAGHLTASERETLDAAERILVAVLRDKQETLMFSLHGGWDHFTVTYFTPNKVQHGSLWTGDGCCLSRKIARAINLRTEEDGRADKIKAERVERLKAELALLMADDPTASSYPGSVA